MVSREPKQVSSGPPCHSCPSPFSGEHIFTLFWWEFCSPFSGKNIFSPFSRENFVHPFLVRKFVHPFFWGEFFFLTFSPVRTSFFSTLILFWWELLLYDEYGDDLSTSQLFICCQIECLGLERLAKIRVQMDICYGHQNYTFLRFFLGHFQIRVQTDICYCSATRITQRRIIGPVACPIQYWTKSTHKLSQILDFCKTWRRDAKRWSNFWHNSTRTNISEADLCFNDSSSPRVGQL